jgi:mRNA interferase MazF
MSAKRGDIVLLDAPFLTRSGSKIRPVLIVQNNRNNARMGNTIVAVITTNLSRSAEPTQVLIDPSTPSGKPTGLFATSVVSCENLLTVRQSHIRRWLGTLPTEVMQEVDKALRVSLGLE